MNPVIKWSSLTLPLLFALALCQPASAATGQPGMLTELQSVQKQWAQIYYQTNGAHVKVQALDALTSKASALADRYPQRAEPKIWLGIVLGTHAGLNGGLGALKMVKRARGLFERAIELDETALSASAHVSLGALYYQVPSWPLAFGSNRKARHHLERALAIAPDNIDGNFFMAGFLEKVGEHDRAIKVLQHASKLPDRPERPVADTGRREEIAIALKRVRDAALN